MFGTGSRQQANSPSIETNTVSQELNGFWCSFVWSAVGGGKVVGALHCSVSFQLFLSEVVALASEAEDDIGDINLVLWSQCVLIENGVASGDLKRRIVRHTVARSSLWFLHTSTGTVMLWHFFAQAAPRSAATAATVTDFIFAGIGPGLRVIGK